MERVGDWMQTYTGRQFWPIDPRPSEVCIEDIAHSLSMQCRYGGHVTRFYSVAEHCCHVHDACSDQNKLWALMHDASEAYIQDVIRPLKPSLTEYKFFERKLMVAVCSAFDMPTNQPPEVDVLDKRILGDEAAQVMSAPPAKWYYQGKPLGVKIHGWLPETAKAEFLERFNAAYPTPHPIMTAGDV